MIILFLQNWGMWHHLSSFLLYNPSLCISLKNLQNYSDFSSATIELATKQKSWQVGLRFSNNALQNWNRVTADHDYLHDLHTCLYTCHNDRWDHEYALLYFGQMSESFQYCLLQQPPVPTTSFNNSNLMKSW